LGEVRKIEVPISSELAAEIDAAIAAGDYRDFSDLVSEMLDSWHSCRHDDSERLRRLWKEGLASGEPIEGGFDLEDIKRRGMERLSCVSFTKPAISPGSNSTDRS
jgi:antitoxin ParD1/3/4